MRIRGAYSLLSAIRNRYSGYTFPSPRHSLAIRCAAVFSAAAAASTVLCDSDAIGPNVTEFGFESSLQNHTYLDIYGKNYLGKFPALKESNALHGTLYGEGMIETYEVFRKKDDEISFIVKFGNRVHGHPGIVHGGVTSLVFDQSFGWMFILLGTRPAYTVNLSVNFRYPICQ